MTVHRYICRANAAERDSKRDREKERGGERERKRERERESLATVQDTHAGSE